MASPPSEQPESAKDGAAGRRATRTFVLEVSAGRPKGVGDATHARIARTEALPAPVLIDEEGVERHDSHNAAERFAATVEDEAADEILVASADLPPRTVARRRKRTGRLRTADGGATPGASPLAPAAAGLRPRRLSAWSASLGVHGIMIAALLLVAIPQRVRRDVMDLFLAPAAPEELEMVVADEESEDEPIDAELEEFVAAASGQTVDPGLPTLGMEQGAGVLGELTSDVALVGGGGGGAESGPFGGLGGAGGLFGTGTGGSAEFGTGLGGSPTAEFFGAKIDGRRIVFVLDNSGSMQAGRLETVIAELLATVDRLERDQSFYVVFYSDAAYPLFYPDAAQDFVRPTDQTKRQLARWLDTVELCLGDAVQEALAGAISIEPDCVFLLSDGRIQGEKKMRFLLEAGGGDFPIHTIGVGLGKNAVASRRNLQMIAEANGGEFREAAVPQEMRELALTKPRPYHSETPGPVWGRNVKGWGVR